MTRPSASKLLDQLFKNGAVHVSTFVPGTRTPALRTVLFLDGDVCTQINASCFTQQLYARHQQAIQRKIQPLRLWFRRLSFALRSLTLARFTLAGFAGIGMLTFQLSYRSAYSLSGHFVRLLAAGFVTVVLPWLLRVLFSFLVRWKLRGLLSVIPSQNRKQVRRTKQTRGLGV